LIREADKIDCEELGVLHTISWQEAYSNLIPQPFLDALDPISRGKQWESNLNNGKNTVLLDIQDEALAGFFCFSKCRVHDAAENWGEISALYYLEKYYGKGLGNQLMKRAMDTLLQKKFGFEFDGCEKTDDRKGVTLHERRMRFA
jgi:L-amino acid N-acyltransferase YncA